MRISDWSSDVCSSDLDFNGDGKSDILWRNIRTGRNTIWKSGDRATEQAMGSVANLRWKIAAIGDYNGDGKSDVLWRHSVSGANSIWKSANVETLQEVTGRSEETTSELQSLMRTSYAVYRL